MTHRCRALARLQASLTPIGLLAPAGARGATRRCGWSHCWQWLWGSSEWPGGQREGLLHCISPPRPRALADHMPAPPAGRCRTRRTSHACWRRSTITSRPTRGRHVSGGAAAGAAGWRQAWSGLRRRKACSWRGVTCGGRASQHTGLNSAAAATTGSHPWADPSLSPFSPRPARLQWT